MKGLLRDVSSIRYHSYEDMETLDTSEWNVGDLVILLVGHLVYGTGDESTIVKHRYYAGDMFKMTGYDPTTGKNTFDPVSNNRLVSVAGDVEKIVSHLVDPVNNSYINGASTFINTLKSTTDNLAGKTSKMERHYGLTTDFDTNGNHYITGFGMNAAVEVAADGSTTTSSDFSIRADKFQLIDPDTQNKVLMDENGLIFKKASGEVSRYLQTIKTHNNVPNGQEITLTNVIRPPHILMGLNTMPTYKQQHKEQDQSFTFDYEITHDGSGKDGDGEFKFIPYARLHLSTNLYTKKLSTRSDWDDSNDTHYGPVYTIPADLSGITINFTINSIKKERIQNTYRYRKCTSTLECFRQGAWHTVPDSQFEALFFSTTLEPVHKWILSEEEDYLKAGYQLRVKCVFADYTFSDGSTTFSIGDHKIREDRRVNISLYGKYEFNAGTSNYGSRYKGWGNKTDTWFGERWTYGRVTTYDYVAFDNDFSPYYEGNARAFFYYKNGSGSLYIRSTLKDFNADTLISQYYPGWDWTHIDVKQPVSEYGHNNWELTDEKDDKWNAKYDHSSVYHPTVLNTKIRIDVVMDIYRYHDTEQVTGTVNSGNSFFIKARAKSSVELGTGTLNIITVE